MSIGLRIAEERKRLGLTQAAFAEIAGVSLSAQKRYETSERIPSMNYVGKISDIGANIGYIVAGVLEADQNSPFAQDMFFSGFDGKVAVTLAFKVLELNMDNFLSDAFSLISEPGTPETKIALIDALIANSPPLLERLNAIRRESTPKKKRGAC